jgi:prephenate dehydrogenase
MRLEDVTVAVVGLGLMGGSLAMSMRGQCGRVVGIARREETARLALAMGAVDHATRDLGAVADADIVVLATPVRHIIASIPEAGALMRQDSLLMDLGSTKVEVVKAMNALPAGIAAVGGHPMCGKETGGLESAEVGLFHGATFVLAPTERTEDGAMLLAEEMVRAAGAVPLKMDAGEHDRAVATISHLPYLLAASLVHVEMEAEDVGGNVERLAASGFRDTSRLAASSLEMMLDILLTNREPVMSALEHFEEKIAEVKGLLDDPDGLREWMARARCKRKEMYR